jgi:hypothetical protein
MKNLLLIIVCAFATCGCSTDDDQGGIIQSLAVVTSVDMPENFEFAREYRIKVNYQRPTGCDRFSGFDISKNRNIITVGVVTSSSTSIEDCSSTGNLQADAELNFVAELEDFYIFKFWQGEINGEVQFLTVQVPVIRPGMQNIN